MKAIPFLLLLSLGANNLIAQTTIFKLLKPIPQSVKTASDDKLKSKALPNDFGVINIADLKAYINENSSKFNSLYISYGFTGGNKKKIYFTALAGNTIDNTKSIKEFSSLDGNGQLKSGDKLKFRNKFSDKQKGPFGFLLNLEEVTTMLDGLQVVEGAGGKAKVDAVYTVSNDGDNYINLVFSPANDTSGTLRYSTFDADAGALAPAQGCPPFNCRAFN